MEQNTNLSYPIELPLKTLIVEDKKRDLVRLTKRLEKYPEIVQITATASSYFDARNILLQNEFALSILDYDLKNKTLIDLLNTVNRKHLGIIVLSSIYRTNIDIYELIGAAIDLPLPKPHDDEVVQDFILKLQAFVLLKSVQNKPYYFREKNENKLVKLFANDIYYIEAKEKNAHFHCVGRKKEIIVDKSLTALEDILDNNKFIRCHDSYIINIEKVRGFSTDNSADPLKIYFDLDYTIKASYSDTYIPILLKRKVLKPLKGNQSR